MNKLLPLLVFLLLCTAHATHADNWYFYDRDETVQIADLDERTEQPSVKKDFFQFACLVCCIAFVHDSFEFTVDDRVFFSFHPVSTFCKIGGQLFRWTGKGLQLAGHYCKKIGL